MRVTEKEFHNRCVRLDPLALDLRDARAYTEKLIVEVNGLRAELELVKGELIGERKDRDRWRDGHRMCHAELQLVRAGRDGAKDARDILIGDCLRLGDDNARLRGVLEKIANIDYRGNRSTESDVARAALDGGKGDDDD